MQRGTVEWELNQRRLRAEQREEDREWAEIQAKHEAESKSFGDRLGSILDRKNAGSSIWVFVGEVQLEFTIHGPQICLKVTKLSKSAHTCKRHFSTHKCMILRSFADPKGDRMQSAQYGYKEADVLPLNYSRILLRINNLLHFKRANATHAAIGAEATGKRAQ